MCSNKKDCNCDELLDKLVEKTNKLVIRCQKLKEKADKKIVLLKAS